MTLSCLQTVGEEKRRRERDITCCGEPGCDRRILLDSGVAIAEKVTETVAEKEAVTETEAVVEKEAVTETVTEAVVEKEAVTETERTGVSLFAHGAVWHRRSWRRVLFGRRARPSLLPWGAAGAAGEE